MPLNVLEAVLQEVALAQGDSAYLTLALTCKCFEAVVSEPVFKKKTHFAWLDGNDVTLSCNYSGTVNLLLWYRQTPSSSPQLVTSGYSDTTGRVSLRHEKTRKTFHLLISSAAVTDSAVYY
uniref:Ig-like domain-containing protein n=1 Tax=Xiphophorus couchianus TaxID=32473 RepID=A0A3B5LRC8_9TELE